MGADVLQYARQQAGVVDMVGQAQHATQVNAGLAEVGPGGCLKAVHEPQSNRHILHAVFLEGLLHLRLQQGGRM